MAIEAPTGLLGPQAFPGLQGRAAFAFLVTRGGEPVSRTLLADALWGDRLPPSWSAAVSAIVSKLRRLLTRAGLEGGGALIADELGVAPSAQTRAVHAELLRSS